MNKFRKPPSIEHQRRAGANSSTKVTKSLYDIIVPGKEFGSIIDHVSAHPIDVNPVLDIRKCLEEIEKIRGRPCILYVPNLENPHIKSSISIDYSDNLPFNELVTTIPREHNEIDVIISTPGGSGEQVAMFVDKLRRRFDFVGIILPDMAMSAGTIFALSGDEIIMSENSYIGPIDPQVPNREGRYVPAQAIITLVNDINKRGSEKLAAGKQPDWADLEILRRIDYKDLGNAINASNFSIELAENYLKNYKFKSWVQHSSTGVTVTEADKTNRAKEIASQLCDHSLWKSHARGISREQAFDVCRLKIVHSEDIGIDFELKRLWAIISWTFQNTTIYKMFISRFHILLRNEHVINNNNTK